jgi:hypothetical protein
MEAILGISLYSCPYLKYQKCFVFLIIAYFYSSTGERCITGSAWKRGGTGGVGGDGGEMTQTMYTHVNK